MTSVILAWLSKTSLLMAMDNDLGSEGEHASLPSRGWNSYDSFSGTISEEEFLQSAEIISKKLLLHGYEKKGSRHHADSLGFDVIDEWGRMIPDPDRGPSSKGGKGFTEVSKKVHSLGLKFGIHVMNGISTQAVHANTAILIGYNQGIKTTI
ncbi:Glycoside hydrolase [Trema orientale]|uniref:Glycoside hydrolase n=1 Tax=Trema orientale TaxID=63057 RepID=A0A2P5EAR2_TREOI|nr:Glycoside hydrolase [Trema orientale]